MADLQGVLLCSGGGTRMLSLTKDLPKCLLPVAGVPMFLYPLSSLLRAGIKEIVIFVRESVQDVLKQEIIDSDVLSRYPAHVEYIVLSSNQEDLGTSEILRHHHSKITRDALIVSCDFISDSSLIPFIDFFRMKKASMVALIEEIAHAPSPGVKSKKHKPTDLMAFEEESGRIVYLCSEEDFDASLNFEKISEKFPNVALTSKFNDCHVYAIRKQYFQDFVRHRNFISFKADFVPFLIEQQLIDGSDVSFFVYRVPHENGFVTSHANTAGAYLEVNKSILKAIPRIMPTRENGKTFNHRVDGIAMNESWVAGSAQVEKGAVIKRTVVLGSCRIGANAKLKECLVLGDVKIGAGATLSNSIICEGCEVGDSAEVVNCIVTKGQKVQAKAKVQNEVVEEDEEWSDE